MTDKKQKELVKDAKRFRDLRRYLLPVIAQDQGPVAAVSQGSFKPKSEVSRYLAAIGRKGGSSTSLRKIMASKKNGKLGGRPSRLDRKRKR